MDISTTVIENISRVTNIPLDSILKTESSYKFESEIEQYLNENNLTITQYLNKYNYRYLLETEDFIDKGDKFEITKDILKYLRVSSPKRVYELEGDTLYKSKEEHLKFIEESPQYI